MKFPLLALLLLLARSENGDAQRPVVSKPLEENIILSPTGQDKNAPHDTSSIIGKPSNPSLLDKKSANELTPDDKKILNAYIELYEIGQPPIRSVEEGIERWHVAYLERKKSLPPNHFLGGSTGVEILSIDEEVTTGEQESNKGPNNKSVTSHDEEDSFADVNPSNSMVVGADPPLPLSDGMDYPDNDRDKSGSFLSAERSLRAEEEIRCDCKESVILPDTLPKGVYFLVEKDFQLHFDNETETTSIGSWHVTAPEKERKLHLIYDLEKEEMDPRERELWWKKAAKSIKKHTKRASNTAKKHTKKASNTVKKHTKKAANTVHKHTKKAAIAVPKHTKRAENTVKKHTKKITNTVDKAADSVNKEVTKWKDKAEQEANKLANLPKLIQKEIIDPIEDLVDKAEDNILDLENIARKVSDGTMEMLKKIKFLPSFQDLTKMLGDKLMSFLSDGFCVPFNCLAKSFGVDMSNIELYSNEKLSISTALKPETCLSISEVEFDSSKIKKFLDQFGDIEALQEIFDKVKKYLDEQMKKIIDFGDNAFGFMEDIYDDVEHALEKIGLLRRRGRKLLRAEDGGEDIATDLENALAKLDLARTHTRRRLVRTDTGEETSMEELYAMAYENGRQLYEDLYGQHLTRVFRERRLNDNPLEFLGFRKLKLRFKANFGQSFMLTATARTGFSGSLFDEAMHESKTFPVPMTGGLVRIFASGSLEGSMPYALSAEGSAFAEFKYSVGEYTVDVDVISGKMTNQKEDFSTGIQVNATAAASAFMAIKFASSSQMGICLGPTDDACISLSIDVKQQAGAGFDALAGKNMNFAKNPLTAVYSDAIVDYKEQPVCEEELQVAGGYWQYIQAPKVKVVLETSSVCGPSQNILYDLEAKVIQESSDNACLSVADPINKKRNLGELPSLKGAAPAVVQSPEHHRQRRGLGGKRGKRLHHPGVLKESDLDDKGRRLPFKSCILKQGDNCKEDKDCCGKMKCNDKGTCEQKLKKVGIGATCDFGRSVLCKDKLFKKTSQCVADYNSKKFVYSLQQEKKPKGKCKEVKCAEDSHCTKNGEICFQDKDLAELVLGKGGVGGMRSFPDVWTSALEKIHDGKEKDRLGKLWTCQKGGRNA